MQKGPQQDAVLSQQVPSGWPDPPQHTAPSEHVASQTLLPIAIPCPPAQGTGQHAVPLAHAAAQSKSAFSQLTMFSPRVGMPTPAAAESSTPSPHPVKARPQP